MSGKFMKVKRIVVPTLTMLLIASQLCGCAAASQSEMLTMLQSQQSITIEVAEPISVEQGEEKQFEWLELASLTTYSDFRDTVDDIMGVTAFGEGGKNGVIYTDLEGNHTNNSTLYYAFNNQKFLDKVWNNTDATKAIIDAVKENYADIESDAQAKVAFINAYYNLINDAEPNYFNGGSTVTRAEFMSAVYKASNPVQEISANEQFASLVDPSNANENTLFASQIADYSYLDTASKSLNDQTFDGTITRAEAIYTLVKMYYNAEYEAVTGKETCYSDTKNAGDIAFKQGFVTTDKKTGEVTQPTYWKSYELSYSVMNADKGMSADLYKAMVVAKNHNLINGTESRWDEGLTKAECLGLITTVYEDLGTKVAVDRGQAQGEVVDNGYEQSSEQGEQQESNNENTDQPVEEVVGPYDALDGRKHITQNEDGTYSYSDEYIGALAMYDYYNGYTEAQIRENLDEMWVLSVRNLDGESTHLVFSQLKQIPGITTPSESSNSGSSSSSGSSGSAGSSTADSGSSSSGSSSSSTPSGNTGESSNSGGSSVGDELITDPNYKPVNPDPSIWGDADFDTPVGGGERIDTGATLHAGG